MNPCDACGYAAGYHRPGCRIGEDNAHAYGYSDQREQHRYATAQSFGYSSPAALTRACRGQPEKRGDRLSAVNS